MEHGVAAGEQQVRIRVLLVDDASVFLELDRTFLRRTACEVLTAESGEEALAKARDTGFDAIVLNARMPGIRNRY